ncbi:MAG: acyltransferase [Lachnospiraceae bacterium]|nr:acyltransferase [Lachnospiraceae bacterium]
MLLIGKHVQITHGKHIACGKNVKFEDYAEIHGLCSKGLIFGDSVTISRGVMIRPSSYYGGDLGVGLTMGEHSSIGPYGYVGCSGKITIGKNVMFGPKCSLFAENHNFSDTEASIKGQGVNQKGIVIEDDCWIGSNVIILDGVTIGRGSVIGAGTLITKDVPAGSIVVDKRNKIMRARG